MASPAAASPPAATPQGQSPIIRRIDNITKSLVDNREFRGLELRNGLRVMLVSDPEADKSAASMDVQIGHLSDPWELPGVAHFCEHMLFLGTEKYPEENEYSSYLSANAGASNAFTSSDHTNYHFDVKPESLEGALDRFAQFFLGPQFTEDATEREVNAVDSEHANNLKTDSWRFLQIERLLSRPGHDYGKFGTGNKKTLMDDPKEKGVNTREVLLEFHKKFYSSNIMTLCIVGKNPINELEEMVCKLGFADIVNKNVQPPSWDNPYGPEECGRFVEVVPIKDMRSLVLFFPMPDLVGEYKSQSVGYLSHLLGHEGAGSLLSILKKRGWVTALTAGYRTTATGFGAFKMSLELTVDGMEHVQDILTDIFHAVAMIRETGPQEWIFNEYKKLRGIEFAFKDRESPLKLATHIAAESLAIPMTDVMSSPYLLEEYKPDRIRELTEMLRPSNLWYRVSGKKFEGREGNTIEPVYGTEMRVAAIDKESLARYEAALAKSQPYIRLPEPNAYIPEKLDLKPREPVPSEVPVVVHDDRWSRVWFKQDDEYKRPKMFIKLLLTAPAANQDPRAVALANLIAQLLEDSLTEFVYNPELAGLDRECNVVAAGIEIKVRGFDDKLPLFLHDFIQKVVDFRPDPERFVIIKERLVRTLRNFAKSQPYQLSTSFQACLMQEKAWTKEQMLACAVDLTFEDTAAGFTQLLKAFHIESLIHGNVTKGEALTLAAGVLAQFQKGIPGCRPLFANEAFIRREHDLGIGNSFVYRASQPTHEVGSVQMILQTGKRTVRENCLMSLLQQVISEPAFNILRTNEQLGYIVFSWPLRSPSAQSLGLLVQGPKDPDEVEQRIEAFLEDSVKPLLADMTEEKFAEHVSAVITTHEEKPKTLGQKFLRFWLQIENRNYDFRKLEDEVVMLRTLKKQDLIDFFNRKIAKDAPERRKLCILVHPSRDDAAAVAAKRATRSPRVRREVGGGDVEEVAEREEIVRVDALHDELGYYGKPKPRLDLPPIGVDSIDCLDNDNGGCKAKY